MSERVFNVTFTEDEGTALLNLIDTAVKAQGLAVAGNALALATKLTQAFKESQQPKESKEP
jgi:hypothetical protein